MGLRKKRKLGNEIGSESGSGRECGEGGRDGGQLVRAGYTHLGCLALGALCEESGLGLLDVLSPLGVVGQETGEHKVLGHRRLSYVCERVRECGGESVGESGRWSSRLSEGSRVQKARSAASRIYRAQENQRGALRKMRAPAIATCGRG